MDLNAIIWLVAGLVFVIIELLTPMFFALSVSFGAFVAFFCALLGFSVPIQMVCFISAVVLFFVFLRPVLYHGNKAGEKFGSAALVGMKTVAAEDITPLHGTLRIDGTVWQVRTREGSIPKGERLIIVGFDRIKVIVEKDSNHE
ncbi:MAG: NfeD family protein [Spirochaetia bacterium]|jgi:membrane protein implicated in regulation of membrane protease activity|nr:NfeD family protein [Spirochaetia bacterium]